jgi:hypothetical protein
MTLLYLLGIYPKGYKPTYNRDTCTPMFITALFTAAELWNQSMCSATIEWTRKTWHTHTHTHNGVLFSHKEK